MPTHAQPFGSAEEPVAGLRLIAADSDVSICDGEVVRGPAFSGLLNISGRRVALDHLDGRDCSR